MTERLANNTDLYKYLLSLADLMASRGSQQLAEVVLFAAKQGAGLSTEFLGESRIALRTVMETEKGLLHPHERDKLLSIISQIETALRR